jgi:hypothetical protein
MPNEHVNLMNDTLFVDLNVLLNMFFVLILKSMEQYIFRIFIIYRERHRKGAAIYSAT